jgi:hypothetical protein
MVIGTKEDKAMSTEVVERVTEITAAVASRREQNPAREENDILANEAQRVLRARMEAISHTDSVGGCLNYGSFVVKPAA